MAFDSGLLTQALRVVSKRQQKGHKNFYKPLEKELSRVVRHYYRGLLNVPVRGSDDVVIKNAAETLIATGYKRVVIGDYGAFVELMPRQLERDNIEPRWPGHTPAGGVSYVWMQTKDDVKTKVYEQKRSVLYANYIPGRFYVAPGDVIVTRIPRELTEADYEWKTYCRVVAHEDVFQARRARGGEKIGHPDFKDVAEPGEWLCHNPKTDWYWTMSDESFEEFYCPINKKRFRIAAQKKKKGSWGDSDARKAGSSFD